jgi:predicted alpha/beta superfamily hydrolase
MKKSLFVLILLGINFIFGQIEKIKPFSIGEIVTLHSTILSENRILNIVLPEAYETNQNEKYSVIYLLDGSTNEDILHVSGLVQFFNLQFKMPKCIIVGISNVDRKRDFTFPTTIKKDKEDYPTTGGSEKFIRFLEEELIPYVNSNYHTNGTSYLLGQSLGGLLATEILIKKPYLFTHYLITSPSLWWNNQSILEVAKKEFEKKDYSKTYVYLAVGQLEHKIMVKDAKALALLLNQIKIKKVDFVVFPEENHATILHNSLYKAFSVLFPYKS